MKATKKEAKMTAKQVSRKTSKLAEKAGKGQGTGYQVAEGPCPERGIDQETEGAAGGEGEGPQRGEKEFLG